LRTRLQKNHFVTGRSYNVAAFILSCIVFTYGKRNYAASI